MMNARTNKAFTLIEILVVVGIIAMLTGIGAVAFSKARKATKANMTKSSIGMIGAGAEMFKNDFGVFPPSDIRDTITVSSVVKYKNFYDLGLPANTSGMGLGSGAKEINSGAEIICALLIGYATDTPTTPDGTFSNWVDDDGTKGFGFRTTTRGKVRGPYGGAESAKTQYTGDADDKDSPKVFIDSWNHAILYYRYDTTGNTYNASDNPSVTVDTIDSPVPTNIPNKFKDARKDFLLVSPGEVEGNVDDTTFWKESVTNASVE